MGIRKLLGDKFMPNKRKRSIQFIYWKLSAEHYDAEA